MNSKRRTTDSWPAPARPDLLSLERVRPRIMPLDANRRTADDGRRIVCGAWRMNDDDADIPVRPVQAWADGRGHLYPTKEAALLVEIERVLGHFGTGESMAPGIARLIASKRDELVPLLTAFGPETVKAITLDLVREKRASAGQSAQGDDLEGTR